MVIDLSENEMWGKKQMGHYHWFRFFNRQYKYTLAEIKNQELHDKKWTTQKRSSNLGLKSTMKKTQEEINKMMMMGKFTR